jgi:hypothetical protein
MLENAYYSVISPEGCSVILFKNITEAPRAARALQITARDLKRMSVIDEIVPEPSGGAHADKDAMARTLKNSLVRHLHELLAKDPQHLVEERYGRYRNFGTPAPVEEPRHAPTAPCLCRRTATTGAGARCIKKSLAEINITRSRAACARRVDRVEDCV